MIKKILPLILTLTLSKAFSQNVIQSAIKIHTNRCDTQNYSKVFSELAKYITGLNGVKLSETDSLSISYKSVFLEKYINPLINRKNLIVNSAQSKSIYEEKDRLNKLPLGKLGINLDKVKNFKDIIGELKSKDSTFLSTQGLTRKNLDSLIKEVNKIALANFLKNTSFKGDKLNELILGFTKKLSADGTPSINTNNTFEIQDLNAIKKQIKLPSESDIIDALAIFLVNRVKEESVIAFVEHLNKNIDKLQPLPCLFKNTTKELSAYSPGGTADFGSITQKAIAVDLAQMPDNIADCNFCGNNDVKKNKDFTDFFNDISGGVDLITNVSFYADKADPSDRKFNYVLQLFNFINKYYSNVYEKDEKSATWIGPDFINGKNDTILKLSLALVYEKEQPLFNEFLKTRFNCKNLDEFLANKDTFEVFKTNFKQLFYNLHKLDSYWQSHKTDKKALVDMEIYKQKIADVFSGIYKVMNFEKDSFALSNPTYSTYVKAKTAAAEKDIQGIVYYSQQLLDLLKCYEIKLPGFKLPHFSIKRNSGACSDTLYSSVKQLGQFVGDTSVKINEIKNIHNFYASDKNITKLTQELLCHKKTIKCKAFNWSFNHYRKKIDEYGSSGDYKHAMHLKFRPWLHPFMMTFHYPDWKLAIKLKKIRAIHIKQMKLDSLPEFKCYLESEEKLQNKTSFYGSRREVSQVLNFFTDITKSKDSKQLSQVVSKYAEPAQSYRIKRFNNFSVDINAYPGVFIGVETRTGNAPYSKDKISSIVSGITAPIGISFSRAARVKFKCEYAGKKPAYINRFGNIKSFKGGCFSATFMIIDIGAVVSYRFANDTSKALPREVNFNQVLAPGFNIGYGIPNLPLVLNAGIQYTPQLRTFDNENGKMLDTYRIGLSLCYDIPLLNITNTTKRNRKTTLK